LKEKVATQELFLLDLEKCTKQLALNVARNVKCLSSQLKEEKSSAEIVTARREVSEDFNR